jgi:outer membrane protein OmpA-like peptidoglycan-associated protein
MDTPFELVVTSRRLRSLFIGLTGFVAMTPEVSTAEFDPPRIVHVVNLVDSGGPVFSDVRKLYNIDKGQETDIANGDTLNVYREKRISSLVQQQVRIFIGTLTITDAQQGSALGTFQPNDSATGNHAVRHKFAMKGDFVIPRLVLDSNVLFEAAKAELRGFAKAEFLKVADFIKFHSPSKLIIEGHTDSDGDDNYNKRLSQLRADSVRNLLVNDYDFITEDMIEAKGYGEERPRTENDTAVNKAINRRIEVLVWWESLEERVDARELDEEELLELEAAEQ